MKTISPRHHLFIDNYCNPNKETFGNAYKSYIGAGFKDTTSARKSSIILQSDPNISQLIREKTKEYSQVIEQKCNFDDNFIRSEWLQLLDQCKQNGDRTNANSVLRTMAMSRAMLTDKYQDASVDNVPKLAGDDLKYYKAMANQYIKSRTMAEKVPGLRSNALKINKGITDGKDEKTA